MEDRRMVSRQGQGVIERAARRSRRHDTILLAPEALNGYRPAPRIVRNGAFNTAIDVIHHVGDGLVEYAQCQLLWIGEEAVKNLPCEGDFGRPEIGSGDKNPLPDLLQLL